MLIVIGLILAVGFFFLLMGFWLLLKGIWLLTKAGFYKWIASPKQIDEGYKKEVLAKNPDYKRFTKGFDDNLNDFLNN